VRGPWRVERIGVLALVWVWGTGAVLAGQPPGQEQEATGGCEATVVAHVNNFAAIGPDHLAVAERETARIYEAIGVRILWVRGPEPRPDLCGLPLQVLLLTQDGVTQLEVSRKQALSATVFGFIARETGRAYILTHRVINMERRYGDDYRRLLGQTIAHELGHLLLPSDSHADRGIMQAHLGVRAYSASYFTPEQGAAIRARLAAAATRHGALTDPR
jgi:hypothetical protein